MVRSVMLVLFVGGLTVCGPARAAFLNNATGLSTPANTITFESPILATNANVTNQFGSGVTFLNAYFDGNGGPDAAPFNGFTGHHYIADYGYGPFVNNPDATGTLTIIFGAPQTAAAFALATDANTTTTINAMSGAVQVGTWTGVTSFDDLNPFHGFTGITFDRLQITVVPDASGTLQFAVDNVQFGVSPVPEASRILLAAVGGLALVGLARRRPLHAA